VRWVGAARVAARIRNSPVIRRRTGVRKYEIDLRRSESALASRPLKIGAIVFLSARPAAGRPLLTRLPPSQALPMLIREQCYAANRPPWNEFACKAARLPFFEMWRGRHPRESAAALRSLME
jgi:hypothetical protein